jgi:2-methylfumaryl-CoA isomerase
MIVALTGRQWANLVEATQLHEAVGSIEKLLGVDLSREGDRFEAREVIGAALKPWTTARSMEEIRATFDAHGVCWGPYQTFMELVDEDPRCSPENPMFGMVEQPGIGTYLMPGSPVRFDALQRVPPSRAPLLGEHTEEVLTGLLGRDAAEVARLRDDGVIGGPRSAAGAAGAR